MGGEYKRFLLLLTLIYRIILGFFPSFIIVSTSKFSDTLLKISKSVPGLCRSSPWRKCRTGHFLWVIQARAVKRYLVGPWYLLLLEMPGCRHAEDESFRGFLSQARREKRELMCCAVRNSEVLKRSFPFETHNA